MKQVVGIMLVHNEDLFLRRAVENVLHFCDRILIAEHRSTDGTRDQAVALARAHEKVEVHAIRDPRESNHLLGPFVGTDTWVFGVDGDELYDPIGLQRTRQVLESGVWDPWWVVFGNVLHCIELDESRRLARGYQSPPCRSMTKLYNFSALEALDELAPQRLMGRHDRFRAGWSASLRLDVYKETSWEEAHFRCLHTCFLPRSSQSPVGRDGRPNLTDLAKRPLWQRVLPGWLQPKAASFHKQEKYRRGAVVTTDATPFLG